MDYPASFNSQREMDFTPLPESRTIPTNVCWEPTEYWVKTDADASRDYLIVTGYSSLEYLIGFFTAPAPETKGVFGWFSATNHSCRKTERPMAGSEGSSRERYRGVLVEQGISIDQSAAVIKTIQLLEKGVVTFRLCEGLHAKIYAGDRHLIAGSSNFSRSGLREQKEANARFDSTSDYYRGLKEVAEYYSVKGPNTRRECWSF